MNELERLSNDLDYLNGPLPVWVVTDEASGDGEEQPIDKATAELVDVIEALHGMRDTYHDWMVDAVRVIEGQQRQINALSRKVNEHRHPMGGDRGWSGKPEF